MLLSRRGEVSLGGAREPLVLLLLLPLLLRLRLARARASESAREASGPVLKNFRGGRSLWGRQSYLLIVRREGSPDVNYAWDPS